MSGWDTLKKGIALKRVFSEKPKKQPNKKMLMNWISMCQSVLMANYCTSGGVWGEKRTQVCTAQSLHANLLNCSLHWQGLLTWISAPKYLRHPQRYKSQLFFFFFFFLFASHPFPFVAIVKMFLLFYICLLLPTKHWRTGGDLSVFVPAAWP